MPSQPDVRPGRRYDADRRLRRAVTAAVTVVLVAGVGSAFARTGGAATGPAAGTGQHTAPGPAAVSGPLSPGRSSVAEIRLPDAASRVSQTPLFPLPAAPAYPTGCPIRPAPPGYGVIPRPPVARVPEARVPAPVMVPQRTVDTSAATGTGIWVTIFKGSPFTARTADDIVAHAVRAHLTSIWIRTGSTTEGLFGQQALTLLLPRAHAHDLKVIGWDFPTLSDPVADARRMVTTLRLVEAGQQVDGVSPDVETKSEGVFLTGRRVAAYFSRVSAAAGPRPVIATVLRPTDYWWAGNYPYRAEAPYADVFAPMVYWSCQEPGVATAQALDRLRTLGRPVHVIGQAYDEGKYGRRGLPSPREIWRFLDVSRRDGAAGASLYLYEEMRGPLWQALGAYPWAAATR